ncbi:probable ribose-5-phosphate isomerase 2 [Elaeis guineensis]|uniref:ribose-5-phosphate isomerase n=1 Tax=Elaeis guineensis var. tenera TaxID=51953 RepID=A0A6I9RC46_ELAGV|nr:probable ribose-5-phosphate isomerase 2 [Elaeis guineensis]
MRTVCSETLDMAVPFAHLLYSEKPPILASLGSPPAVERPAAPAQDDLKRIAAHRAVELLESGMVVGLGTGSTAAHALDRIGELLRRGVLRDIVGIPTSKKTEAHAAAVGIPLSDLHAHPIVDISIDGADEVDPSLNLVKGRGGSLLREKMIEGASRRFVVIVDESKMVPCLGGSGLAVPVEVIPFCWGHTLGRLRSLFDGEPGFDAKLRRAASTGDGGKGEPFVTDNRNYIVDLFFDNGIHGDLDLISDKILRITGVVEHGMFLGMASSVIIAGKDGVTVLDKQ